MNGPAITPTIDTDLHRFSSVGYDIAVGVIFHDVAEWGTWYMVPRGMVDPDDRRVTWFATQAEAIVEAANTVLTDVALETGDPLSTLGITGTAS